MLETLSLDIGPRGHVNRLGIMLPYHNAGGHRGLFKVIVRLRFFNRFSLYFRASALCLVSEQIPCKKLPRSLSRPRAKGGEGVP